MVGMGKKMELGCKLIRTKFLRSLLRYPFQKITLLNKIRLSDYLA